MGPRLDGPPDAPHGRLHGHSDPAPAPALARPAHRGVHRPRSGRRTGALLGGGDERLYLQTHRAGGISGHGFPLAPERFGPPPPLPGELPPIADVDTASGLARVVGNTELYRSLLRSFCEAQEATASALQSALEEGSSLQVQQLAHRLKGEAGNLGLGGVFRWSSELEAHPHQMAILRALLEATAQTSRHIQAALPAPAHARCASLERSELMEVISRLRGHLEASEGAALGCMDELQALLDGQTEAGRLQQLFGCIRDFQFDAAHVELRRLAELLQERGG